VSEPELFVVCKNCGSEVSPYVTECPYCGQRVRKRAPRIDRRAPAEEGVRRRRRRGVRRMPSLGRLRRDEIPGIAPDTRPYATGILVLLSLAGTLIVATQHVSFFDLGAVYVRPVDDWWRLAATPFLHDNAGYQFITLVAVALFGMHLERRFGWLAPILVFMISGAAGAALSVAVDPNQAALGANGAALGVLCAWLVEDRLAFRRGEDRGNDLLGVYVFAVVLLLTAVAWDDASVVAGVGGAAVGAVLGLPLSAIRR
jgi:membrane associated rhomboid family serine protease